MWRFVQAGLQVQVHYQQWTTRRLGDTSFSAGVCLQAEAEVSLKERSVIFDAVSPERPSLRPFKPFSPANIAQCWAIVCLQLHVADDEMMKTNKHSKKKNHTHNKNESTLIKKSFVHS